MNTKLAETQDIENNLNQELFINYGSRLSISKVIQRKNNVELIVDYRRIVHILDSSTNTIYVRSIQFPSIYHAEISLKEHFNLPLDELNKTIENNYIELRANISRGILSNKKIIIPL